jgi:hypothetical protein
VSELIAGDSVQESFQIESSRYDERHLKQRQLSIYQRNSVAYPGVRHEMELYECNVESMNAGNIWELTINTMP